MADTEKSNQVRELTTEEVLQSRIKSIDEDIEYTFKAVEVHKRRKEALQRVLTLHQANPAVAEAVDKLRFEREAVDKLQNGDVDQ